MNPVVVYCILGGAALVLCCGTGFLFLLHLKRELVKGILQEKCASAGVLFVIPPVTGDYRPPGKKAGFLRPGIVCMTEHEVIFVPLWGSRIVRVPRDGVRTTGGRKFTVIRTREGGVLRAAASPPAREEEE